jgi:hypothetical protein
MSSQTDRYRAFARDCIKWSQSAKILERREALLDMATHWAKLAAQLDYQNGLAGDFATLVRQANKKLRAAREEPNGRGQLRRQCDERGDASTD